MLFRSSFVFSLAFLKQFIRRGWRSKGLLLDLVEAVLVHLLHNVSALVPAMVIQEPAKVAKANKGFSENHLLDHDLTLAQRFPEVKMFFTLALVLQNNLLPNDLQ